jgi:hypothetical protein
MTSTTPWAVQREAATRLGISERTLHRWRAAGLLKAGEHFRRKFPNPNSPLLYHLERCEQRMNEACGRDPGRLELAAQQSTSSTLRPLERVLLPWESGRVPLATPACGTANGQSGEDAEPLADSGIHTAAGPIAEDAGGVVRGGAARTRRCGQRRAHPTGTRSAGGSGIGVRRRHQGRRLPLG